MANTLHVLRNKVLFKTYDEAVAGLQKKLGTLSDGEMCTASYGDNWVSAKTIFGFVRYDGTSRGYTIYDSNSDVANRVKNKLIIQGVTDKGADSDSDKINFDGSEEITFKALNVTDINSIFKENY